MTHRPRASSATGVPHGDLGRAQVAQRLVGQESGHLAHQPAERVAPCPHVAQLGQPVGQHGMGHDGDAHARLLDGVDQVGEDATKFQCRAVGASVHFVPRLEGQHQLVVRLLDPQVLAEHGQLEFDRLAPCDPRRHRGRHATAS